jgi:nicotinate-nucleotide adenylyltransferase
MRVGVFGGTFDPVHLGHLILAEQCREQARLDQVWFVPAAAPPHKRGPITPFERRVEMLALAVAGHPAFKIDPIENEYEGPSFTATTLAELRRRHPDDELLLVVGSDSLNDLPKWYMPEAILRAAALLVVARPDHPILPTDQLRAGLALPAEVPLRLEVVEAPLIEIASTDLRRRAAEGRSLRYLVPRAVECYILEKRLYQEPEPRKESAGH